MSLFQFVTTSGNKSEVIFALEVINPDLISLKASSFILIFNRFPFVSPTQLANVQNAFHIKHLQNLFACSWCAMCWLASRATRGQLIKTSLCSTKSPILHYIKSWACFLTQPELICHIFWNITSQTIPEYAVFCAGGLILGRLSACPAHTNFSVALTPNPEPMNSLDKFTLIAKQLDSVDLSLSLNQKSQ